MFKISIMGFLTFLCSTLAAKPVPLTTVNYVDLNRYLGRWYEIARLPFKQQEGCYGTTADYAQREDGRINVVNQCFFQSFEGKPKIARAVARVADTNTNAKLEVQFFWPFWGDYWIIHLDTDYQYALVGEPKRRYLWILTRSPKINTELLESLKEIAVDKGYNILRLQMTPQR